MHGATRPWPQRAPWRRSGGSARSREMTEPVRIVDYNRQWPRLFQDRARAIRAEMGDVALRIDHIGSTAVVGLAAKPIIDVQISVASFEPLEAFKGPLERLGYVYRADNTERTKRYFREPPGRRRTHVHVRRAGSFSEQWALLFRDYLRAHTEVAAEYAAVKRRLALRFRDDRRASSTPRGRCCGRSSARPTSGPKPRDGCPAPATPELQDCVAHNRLQAAVR
jgi:GrpB-like predicted nucleotidyltransferase (UPF0157 family)